MSEGKHASMLSYNGRIAWTRVSFQTQDFGPEADLQSRK